MIRTSLTRVQAIIEKAIEQVIGAIPPRVRRWVNFAVLFIGVTALVVAAAFIVQPAALERVIDLGVIEQQLSGTLGIIAVMGGIVVGSTISIWKGATATSEADVAPIRDPHTGEVGQARLTGRSFDESFQAAIETGAEEHRTAVISRLREVAIETIATTEGETETTVRKWVLTGAWTDDIIVGALLGDEQAADAPLKWRLYAWLYPDRAFRKAVERAIAAIEAYEPEETL